MPDHFLRPCPRCRVPATIDCNSTTRHASYRVRCQSCGRSTAWKHSTDHGLFWHRARTAAMDDWEAMRVEVAR